MTTTMDGTPATRHERLVGLLMLTDDPDGMLDTFATWLPPLTAAEHAAVIAEATARRPAFLERQREEERARLALDGGLVAALVPFVRAALAGAEEAPPECRPALAKLEELGEVAWERYMRRAFELVCDGLDEGRRFDLAFAGFERMVREIDEGESTQ